LLALSALLLTLSGQCCRIAHHTASNEAVALLASTTAPAAACGGSGIIVGRATSRFLSESSSVGSCLTLFEGER